MFSLARNLVRSRALSLTSLSLSYPFFVSDARPKDLRIHSPRRSIPSRCYQSESIYLQLLRYLSLRRSIVSLVLALTSSDASALSFTPLSQLYAIFPDLIKVILVKIDGGINYVDDCLNDPNCAYHDEENPFGIPTWKMVGFSYFGVPEERHPLGQAWGEFEFWYSHSVGRRAREEEERVKTRMLTLVSLLLVPSLAVVTPIPVDGHTVIGSSIEHKCTATPWVPPSERKNQYVSSFSSSSSRFFSLPLSEADPSRLRSLPPPELSSSARFTPTSTATKQPGRSRLTKPSRTKRVSISSAFRKMIPMEEWLCLLVSPSL